MHRTLPQWLFHQITGSFLLLFKLINLFRYLAVAETTTDNKAIVTVYDLLHEGAKKRKVLQGVDLTSGEFSLGSFLIFLKDLSFHVGTQNLVPLHFLPTQSIWLPSLVHLTGLFFCGFGKRTSC